MRVAARAAQGKLPAWQLDFLLKGSLRLEAGGRARPHAWLSAQVPSRVAGCGASVMPKRNKCAPQIQSCRASSVAHCLMQWQLVQHPCAKGRVCMRPLAPRGRERRCLDVCCYEDHVHISGEHTGGDHHARPQAWDELLHLSELAAQPHAASVPADPAGGAPLPAAAEAPAAHALAGVPDAVERDGAAWQAFCTLEAPEGAALPGGLAGALTPIEQLLARPSCSPPCAEWVPENAE